MTPPSGLSSRIARVRWSPRTNRRRVARTAVRPAGIELDVDLLAGQATDRDVDRLGRRKSVVGHDGGDHLSRRRPTIVLPRVADEIRAVMRPHVDLLGQVPGGSVFGGIGGRVREQPVETGRSPLLTQPSGTVNVKRGTKDLDVWLPAGRMPAAVPLSLACTTPGTRRSPMGPWMAKPTRRGDGDVAGVGVAVGVGPPKPVEAPGRKR